MIVATCLALAAAALHAAWNLAAKRSDDRLIALLGQFVVSGVIGGVVVAATRSLPASAWGWTLVTGSVHVPYVLLLARAYDHGDFSIAYPVARGSGAVLAGVGGVALLGDHVELLSVVAIVTVGAGMALLAVGASHGQIATALLVGLSIGVYTVNDSHAARSVGGTTYAFAAFVSIGVMSASYAVASGRGRALAMSLRKEWRVYAVTGSMATLAYALVMLAVRRAPVGYVAALRESSVLVAAFLGTRYLSEGQLHRRTAAAAVILSGLVLLLAAQ